VYGKQQDESETRRASLFRKHLALASSRQVAGHCFIALAMIIVVTVIARLGFPATREMHISISRGMRAYRIGMRNAHADARLAMTRMLCISAIVH